MTLVIELGFWIIYSVLTIGVMILFLHFLDWIFDVMQKYREILRQERRP